MRHTAQARAIPVNLARLRVKRTLLASLFLESFGGSRRSRSSTSSGAVLAITRRHGFGTLCRCGLLRRRLLCRLLLGLGLLGGGFAGFSLLGARFDFFALAVDYFVDRY